MALLSVRPAQTLVLAAAVFALLGANYAAAQTSQTGTVPLAVPVGNSSAGPAPMSSGGGGAVPAPIIMVVDDQRVVGQSKAFKSIQGQIEGQRQAYEKEFAGKQSNLEAAAADLQRQERQPGITADQVEEKRHALVKQQEEIRRDADNRQHALQQGYAEALDKVKQALLEIVQQLAQERHANLVLVRSDLIVFDRTYEVTSEALARLDQKITSVQVTVPTVARQSGAAAPAAATAAAPAKKK